MGSGNVGGAALNIHGDLAGVGHHFAGAAEDIAGGKGGPEVQTENGLYPICFQHAGVAQRLGAAGTLLGRLEDQKHIVGKIFLAA